MLARRLLVMVAVVMGLTALAAGMASTPVKTRDHAVSPADVHGPAPVVGVDVSRTVDLARRRTVAVNEGDLLHLTVRGDALDTVELVGLGLLAPIAPDTPAEFDLRTDRPGSYPIRLLDDGSPAGRLRVTPAGE